MKNSDKEIDKIIMASLSKEEAAYYQQLGEQNIIEMTLGVFKGKNSKIYLLTFFASFLLFGAFIYCAIQFYQATAIKEMMLYGAVGFWCMIGVTSIKLWHWMQMNTNTLLREIKRLEIQVALNKN